jgi:hypothetical protein
MIKTHFKAIGKDNLLHDKIFKTKVSAGYDKPIFKKKLKIKDKRRSHDPDVLRIIKTHLKLTDKQLLD